MPIYGNAARMLTFTFPPLRQRRDTATTLIQSTTHCRARLDTARVPSRERHLVPAVAGAPPAAK